MNVGCASSLGSQQNVFISSAFPFAITASQNIVAGYQQPFCVKCSVKSSFSPLTSSTKDNIMITASQLDCSAALTKKTITNL